MNGTHIDLTDDQRTQLNEVARRSGHSLHEVIHEAIDLFLNEVAPDPDVSAKPESEQKPAAEATESRD